MKHNEFRNVYGIQFHIDFAQLYAFDKAFQIAPDKAFIPSADEKLFYKSIWKNFSKRVTDSSL